MRGSERYLMTFAVLLAFTALELAVVHLEVGRAARITALAGLAISKVALVLWLFMGLREEPRELRATALLPFLVAPAFAVVLMLETAFRARSP
jgi:heme/copper-type cytochrome/quinol oxidase subunit 4